MAHISDIDKIYTAERGRLWRLILRVTGNHATADELVQDTFLRLLCGGAMRDGTVRSYEAYLTRIARNLALNHVRHQQLGVEVSVSQDIVEAIGDDRPSAEVALVARQQIEDILRIILALPPRRRKIFILHRFEGLTYDQIAAQLGISRNTVMVQIVNALADLRRAMK
ncbi:RNA polymerase sigma factor [Celeribacter sp.]|uniref:RNA polymerase sigma factor n=1 Tax=Celeribacter sp. TaxID=1890673 RepID=UPI003A8F67A6